jgi:hypothetical protein
MAIEVASGFQRFAPELIEFLRDLGNTNTLSGADSHAEPRDAILDETQGSRLNAAAEAPLQQWLVELPD